MKRGDSKNVRCDDETEKAKMVSDIKNLLGEIDKLHYENEEKGKVLELTNQEKEMLNCEMKHLRKRMLNF